MLRNHEVICHVCGITSFVLFAVDLDGLKNHEYYDALTPYVLKREGWSVLRHVDDRIGRYIVCPACMAKTVKPDLPTFSLQQTCPKCGAENMKKKWRSGREPGSLVSAEHVERECIDCGYKMAQAPLHTEDKSGDKPRG